MCGVSRNELSPSAQHSSRSKSVEININFFCHFEASFVDVAVSLNIW